MTLDELRKAVESHAGIFRCTKIHDDAVTKNVEFRHDYDPPVELADDLPIPKLADFYETFSNLTLYHEPLSDDSAYYRALRVRSSRTKRLCPYEHGFSHEVCDRR